ncbi:MAG: thioredoxin domain-containing protein [Acidobacteria bacterium]|nr:thioredoxin domain-containing protein [Acidobacteriota bacterium]
MKKQEKPKSGMPLLIIGLVFVAAIIGAIYLYNSGSGSGTTSTASSNSTAARPTPNMANAPAGAPVGVNMLGSQTAAVTVEEFADYQCGGCAAVHPVMKELASAYAGNRNFRFIYRHYPLAIPAHDKSYEASAATEAAGLQGKFWQMQDQLFRNQAAWTANPNYRQIWSEYASNLGMDVQRFQADIAGIQTKNRVDADIQRGRALGVSSTPTVFVNGKPVPFSELNIASLRRIVDAEIASVASAQQSNAAPAANANQ